MPNTDIIPNIINTVADAESVDPLDLPTFYDVIDPDTLTALAATDTWDDPNHLVAFNYYGYRIAVHGPDEVSIHPVDSEA